MCCVVVRQVEVGVAQDSSQRNVDDLKIVVRRSLIRGHFRERIEIVEQDKIAVEGFVNPGRDFRKRLGQAASND